MATGHFQRPSRTPDDTSDLVRVNVEVRDRSSTGTIIRTISRESRHFWFTFT
jgi:hypothetical protein